jgi:PDZ domain
MSIVALWVLARLRFPAQVSTPNPVPTLLTQLAPRSTFEDLAFSVSQLGPRLTPSLVPIDVQAPARAGFSPRRLTLPALKIRADVAVALLTPGTLTRLGPGGLTTAEGQAEVRSDAASGLAVVRVSSESVSALEIWSPRNLQQARYVIAADVASDGASLRPAFVGSLRAVTSAAWSGSIWAAPAAADLAPGTFVFTTEGAWAGLVTEHQSRPAIVPGELVIRMADTLLNEVRGTPGRLGVTVQPLTAAIAAATGATTGVVVTWIDRRGPAFGLLAVTDIVEAINGNTIATPEHWRVHMARLRAGESLVLRVRRRKEVQDIHVSAFPETDPPADRPLGLTMRAVRRVGVEVLRVQPESAAARAGIEAGDILTVVGELDAPTPSQVSQAFAAAPAGQSVLLAMTRGDAHHVLTLEK